MTDDAQLKAYLEGSGADAPHPTFSVQGREGQKKNYVIMISKGEQV